MVFVNASTIDVLRCSQKDEQFVEFYASYISQISRLCNNKLRNKISKIIHPLSEFLYFSITSLSRYQTLGEEYTGSIRFVRSQNNLPSRWIHIFWMFLYIYGTTLFDKTLSHFEKKVKTCKTLTPTARVFLLKWINFILNNKDLLTKYNQTAFYINGKYYFISNRFTEIQYILTRDWMGHDISSKYFNVLGKISLLYIIGVTLNKLYQNHQLEFSIESNDDRYEINSTFNHNCLLCNEIRNNPSILMCGHIFCWKCIYDSFKNSNRCPVCRETICFNGVILLQNY